MTTVAVLGGSGRLGSRVIAALGKRGAKVRALVHSRGIETQREVVIVNGDVRDPSSLDRLLDDADYIVSTLGNLGSPVPDVCTTAVTHLSPLMKARGIARVVSTTGSAARLDTEIGREPPMLLTRRTILMRHMAAFILDAEQHMRLLCASSFDWTVIRAPIMATGTAARATLSVAPAGIDSTLPYDAVARLIVEELYLREWRRTAPFAIPS